MGARHPLRLKTLQRDTRRVNRGAIPGNEPFGGNLREIRTQRRNHFLFVHGQQHFRIQPCQAELPLASIFNLVNSRLVKHIPEAFCLELEL